MRALPIALLVTFTACFARAQAGVSTSSDALPNAGANSNRIAAGTLSRAELHVALDARRALWHPDGDGSPGIPIETFSEAGKGPQIPGPLIRVRAGTIVVATVRNSIPKTVLSMHGMTDRPGDADRPVRVPYGKVATIRFRAGAAGTFYYWGDTTGKALPNRFGADSQLNGALVVDPANARMPSDDRIFVISQWINVRNKDGSPNFNYELDTINGRAWPYTERLSYAQNETVHWRWINTSLGGHPLHLHGFYFAVTSRGDGLADNVYSEAQQEQEVTELVQPGGTFAMTWHADRPGNWLFHCHLAYHIVGHMPVSAMLAGKAAMSDDAYETNYVRHAGMGGLILGFTVHGLKTTETSRAAPPAQRIHLTVEPGADDRADAPSFRYVVSEGDDPEVPDTAIGPPIVLTRGVSYAIDVTNRLKEPTAVHWHGVELADSYYDGVAGYSGYGNRIAPMIDSGQTFEARITPKRAGTFIYHTHMDDVWQLRGGLAGPVIVLEPGAKYDPGTDHAFTITTTHTLSNAFTQIFVNGTSSPPAITVHAGVVQRLRLINMTTFWTNATVSLVEGNRTARWTPFAVDGAYVPANFRKPESAVNTLTIGQTRDFTFVPATPGDLQLQFIPDPSVPNVVAVAIHVVP